MTETTQKNVCQLNQDGYFISVVEADADPLEQGKWLIPGGCVDTLPPEQKSGYVAKWDATQSTWQYIENHMSEKVYSINDGSEVEIKEYGILPDNVTTQPRPSQYHTWSGTEWDITPEASAKMLSEKRAEYTAQIDNAVADVYARFNRFKAEYELREQQAQQFKDNGYQGEVPVQVAAFATPTGKTAREAADIILQQAAHLRSALSELGILRMRKFELSALDHVETLEEHAHTILTAVRNIGMQV